MQFPRVGVSYNGCPSGMYLCKNSGYCSCVEGRYNTQGYCCEYSSGYWTTCSGICGRYGYKVCYDCAGHGCQYWCTCLSGEDFCCQCATPEDVVQQMAQVATQSQ